MDWLVTQAATLTIAEERDWWDQLVIMLKKDTDRRLTRIREDMIGWPYD